MFNRLFNPSTPRQRVASVLLVGPAFLPNASTRARQRAWLGTIYLSCWGFYNAHQLMKARAKIAELESDNSYLEDINAGL